MPTVKAPGSGYSYEVERDVLGPGDIDVVLVRETYAAAAEPAQILGDPHRRLTR
jgi:hypothetical protein